MGFSDIIYPFEWLVSWIMYLWHEALTTIGLPAGNGWTWTLSIVGLVLVIVGGGAMYLGLQVVESQEMRWLGGGILGVLIGVALISPLVGRPLVSGMGWLYRRVFGIVGTMAMA